MRGRHWTWLALGAVVALSFILVAVWHYSSSRTHQLFGTLISRVETGTGSVALTFDDGPSVAHTRAVLDLLDSHDVPATFFLTGREIEENPGLAQAIWAAGHEIGNHSYSHPRMVFMAPSRIREEIERTDAAIQATGYPGPILFRPPYGRKFVILPWFLDQTGRSTIMWDVEADGPDTAENADAIAEKVIADAFSGSIVLMHVMYDSRQASRDALPAIIEGLRAKGLEFVTVSELLEAGGPGL